MAHRSPASPLHRPGARPATTARGVRRPPPPVREPWATPSPALDAPAAARRSAIDHPPAGANRRSAHSTGGSSAAAASPPPGRTETNAAWFVAKLDALRPGRSVERLGDAGGHGACGPELTAPWSRTTLGRPPPPTRALRSPRGSRTLADRRSRPLAPSAPLCGRHRRSSWIREQRTGQPANVRGPTCPPSGDTGPRPPSRTPIRDRAPLPPGPRPRLWPWTRARAPSRGPCPGRDRGDPARPAMVGDAPAPSRPPVLPGPRVRPRRERGRGWGSRCRSRS